MMIAKRRRYINASGGHARAQREAWLDESSKIPLEEQESFYRELISEVAETPCRLAILYSRFQY
jgi:beta-lactamase class D